MSARATSTRATSNTTSPLARHDQACSPVCHHRCSFAAVQSIERTPRRGRVLDPIDPVDPASSTPCAHSCHRGEDDPIAYHVALFPVPMHGPLFPGECLHLRLSVVSALHLFADVTTTGLRVESHGTSYIGWPSSTIQTRLLRRTVAVASQPDASVGALATFHPMALTADPYSFNLHLVVMARYRLLARPHYHRPYPCILAAPLCDVSPPAFPISRTCSPLPTQLCSPSRGRSRPGMRILTPRPIVSHRASMSPPAPRLRPRTRSQTAATAAAAAALPQWEALPIPPLDSFPGAICLPRFVVRMLYAPTLIARAHAAAIAAASCEPPALDPNLLLHPPPPHACPTQWSFWLCSALPSDTHPKTLASLLHETSPIARLAHLIQILTSLSPHLPSCPSSSPRPPRKRRKVSVTDEAVPISVPAADNNTLAKSFPTRIAPLTCSQQENVQLTRFLQKNPWPCSSSNGFQRVNLRYPCLGHFSLLRPSPL